MEQGRMSEAEKKDDDSITEHSDVNRHEKLDACDGEHEPPRDDDDDDNEYEHEYESVSSNDDESVNGTIPSSSTNDHNHAPSDSADVMITIDRPTVENENGVDNDDDERHTLSQYELMRLERIRRNKQKLEQLGLLNATADRHHHPSHNRRRGRKSKSSSSNIQHQMASNAAIISKTQDVSGGGTTTTTEIPARRASLSRSSKTKFNQSVNPNNNDPSSENGATIASRRSYRASGVSIKKKPPMDQFIFLEFKRIRALQNHTLKQAKRQFKSAKAEVRHWQKALTKIQRRQERKIEQSERDLFQGQTLRDLLRNVDARKEDMEAAAKQYDEHQQALLNEANMAWREQQAAKKMELIDALDRFPKSLKRAMTRLNKVLLDRAPRDPPPPRRSKRKNLHDDVTGERNLDEDYNNNYSYTTLNQHQKQQQQDYRRASKISKKMNVNSSTNASSKPIIPSPTVLLDSKSSLMFSQVEPCSSSSRSLADEVIKTVDTDAATFHLEAGPIQPLGDARNEDEFDELNIKTKKQKKTGTTVVPLTSGMSTRCLIAKNVGGWVSPHFCENIDRRWLERDDPNYDYNDFNGSHKISKTKNGKNKNNYDHRRSVSHFRIDYYVPQVGDTVLYYPEGHRQFLQAHPDTLGETTRDVQRIPLWERARNERQKHEHEENRQPRNDGHPILHNGIHNSGQQNHINKRWWDNDWLQEIDCKRGVYPIICRVEETQPEFPPHHPSSETKFVKKHRSDGMIQVVWRRQNSEGLRNKQKGLTHLLRLAVNLRPLTPVLPPHRVASNDPSSTQDEDVTHHLTCPPRFCVVTFPSQVASPFLIPFSWAYSIFHSILPNSQVFVQCKAKEGQNNRNLSSGKVIGFETLRESNPNDMKCLEDIVETLEKILAMFDLNAASTPQAISEALWRNSQLQVISALPIEEVSVVLETWVQLLRRHNVPPTPEKIKAKDLGLQQKQCSLVASNFLHIIQRTIPLWNGILVVRDAYDRKRHRFSPWDLDSQALGSSSNDFLPFSLDESLRLKIELIIEDFCNDYDDAEAFCHLVDDSDAPNYSCAVPLGMALDRIQRRLQPSDEFNGRCYYRHAESILSDVNLIEENCLLYNSPESDLVKKADGVVTELKRRICQLVNSHNRQRDATLKNEIQRWRLTQQRVKASVERGMPDIDDKLPTSCTIFDSNELFIPFKGPICRDWIQAFEPDDSCSQRSNEAVKYAVSTANTAFWIPQAGDKVVYCQSAHVEFLRAHYQSLQNAQCQLPPLRRLESPLVAQDINALTGDVSFKSESSEAEKGDLVDRWLAGCIEHVKFCFPRRPPNDGVFARNSPIFAMEVRFECLPAEITTIYWRPCELSAVKASDDCEDERRYCPRCGLHVRSSFLHPAWLHSVINGGLHSKETPTIFYRTPRGIEKAEVESINRCFNVLKRRCIAGYPPAFFDSIQCITNLKQGIYPATKVKASSLPTFEDLFKVANMEDNVRVGTRGVRCSSIEKYEIELSKSHFLPPWVACTGSDESDTLTLKRCERLFPCPNLSIEFIQLRSRHGFYRDKAAILNDLEESYVQSVLFLLSAPATRKKNPLSIMRLAKVLSSKPNVARCMPSESATLSSTSTHKQNSDSVAFADFHKESTGSRADEGQGTKEMDEESILLAKIESIRRLYATALVCVIENAMVERLFGTLPQPKNNLTNRLSASFGTPLQKAARQRVNLVVGVFGQDHLMNKFSFSSHCPQVRLKIKCDDEYVSGDCTEEGSGSILFKLPDFRNNSSLARLFFGRPAKMNACARCQAYQRSMLECRVIRMHSNIDFDWNQFYKDFGGIDGIIWQLLGKGSDEASSSRCDPAKNDRVVRVETMISAQEQSNIKPETAQDPQQTILELAEGADKESESSNTDPVVLLEKASIAARISSELLRQAKVAAEVPARLHRDFIRLYFPLDPADGHYIYCVVCGLSGDLLCCDGCPNVLHSYCAGLSVIPEGDWFCETCEAFKPNDWQQADVSCVKTEPKLLQSSFVTSILDIGPNDHETSKPVITDQGDEVGETWKTKFIGCAPFDFEKASDLSSILDELRLQRLKSSLPGSSTDTQNVETIACENVVTESAVAGAESVGDEMSKAIGKPKGKMGTAEAMIGDSSENTIIIKNSDAICSEPEEALIKVGTLITKYFAGTGDHVGEVVSLPTADHSYYRIRYDDMDEEDMSEDELQDFVPLSLLKTLKQTYQKML